MAEAISYAREDCPRIHGVRSLMSYSKCHSLNVLLGIKTCSVIHCQYGCGDVSSPWIAAYVHKIWNWRNTLLPISDGHRMHKQFFHIQCSMYIYEQKCIIGKDAGSGEFHTNNF